MITTTSGEIRERVEICYRLLAGAIGARKRCDLQVPRNVEWFDRHSNLIHLIEREILPRGSGVDAGTTVDLDRSTEEKIVLHTAFHHMDEGGSYDGWTEHTITIRPSLVHGIGITIGGRDRNGIKEYLGDLFHDVLTSTIVERHDQATGITTILDQRYALPLGGKAGI